MSVKDSFTAAKEILPASIPFKIQHEIARKPDGTITDEQWCHLNCEQVEWRWLQFKTVDELTDKISRSLVKSAKAAFAEIASLRQQLADIEACQAAAAAAEPGKTDAEA